MTGWMARVRAWAARALPAPGDMALYSAGWRPDRVDPGLERALAQLAAHGHPVFPAVRTFLATDGGLVISHSGGYLDFQTAALSVPHEDVFGTDLEALIGEPLCFIGMWQGTYLHLGITPSGAIYGCFGDDITRCGVGDAAVRNMITGTGIESCRQDAPLPRHWRRDLATVGADPAPTGAEPQPPRQEGHPCVKWTPPRSRPTISWLR